MRIVFRAKALREMEAIERHIAKDSPRAAARLIAEIERKIGQLGRHPLSAPEGQLRGTRCLVMSGSPNLVIYAVRTEEAVIIAVLHGSRNRRY